jgi:hypothetical protein
MLIPSHIRKAFLEHVKSSMYHTPDAYVQEFNMDDQEVCTIYTYSPNHRIFEKNMLTKTLTYSGVNYHLTTSHKPWGGEEYYNEVVRHYDNESSEFKLT